MADLYLRVCEWLRNPPPGGQPPDEVLTAARTHDVHLVIGDRHRLPALADELREAAVLEEVRARELRTVLAALADAGVEPVLLKGAALARTLYARPELRPRSDTDLMIPDRARDRTARALEALLYRRPAEIEGELAVGQFHFVRVDRHDVPHALDVHWRVSNVRLFADVLSYEELRRDAIPLPALGPNARGPSPEHALLLACVHRVAHHRDTRHLLWLLDVHLLARAFTRGQRDAFIQLAIDRRMQAVCARALRLSQQAFGDLGLEWRPWLAASEDADEPSRVFLGGRLRPAEILLADLGATAGWTDRARLLREHVLPGLDYMRARYPDCPAALLPIAYVGRVLGGLPRWLRRDARNAARDAARDA